MKKSIRLGFSLLDLVVAFVLLPVAAAIFFPAVQNARASAQKNKSNDNLRQIAIAVHNWHGTYNRMPNAAWTGGIYTGKENYRSMWFQLLPFMEYDNEYKNNQHDAVIAPYIHPDDKSVTDKKGKLSYAANIRIFGYITLTAKEANSAVDAQKGTPTGTSIVAKMAPGMSSGLTLARIADGTSNTFMIATRYAECGSPAQSTYYSGSPSGTFLATGGNPASTGVPKTAGKGGFFGAGSHSKAGAADSKDAIFQTAPTVEKCIADNSVFGHSFGAKGLTVALCDASIKNIDPTMTPTTFCRALCPSDGYPLDNDWNTD
jgi:hypothetical protein